MPNILRKRDIYTDLNNAEKKQIASEAQQKDEQELKKLMDDFIDSASKKTVENIKNVGIDAPQNVIEKAISDSINDSVPSLGIKAKIDAQKKKILISQTYSDKPLADIVYQALLFNNVSPEDILYNNCDNEVCRVPEEESVYDYLRKFFVDSYSDQKPFIIFITSQNAKESWGAITEVGVCWITQADHRIFNISPFRPEHPLDDARQWYNTERESGEFLVRDFGVNLRGGNGTMPHHTADGFNRNSLGKSDMRSEIMPCHVKKTHQSRGKRRSEAKEVTGLK